MTRWYLSAGMLSPGVAGGSATRTIYAAPGGHGSARTPGRPCSLERAQQRVGRSTATCATSRTTTVTANWSDLGLAPTRRAAVRDLWTHTDLGAFATAFGATVPAHGARLLHVRALRP